MIQRLLTLSALAAALGGCGGVTPGVVSGGIEPCQAILFPGGPTYAAGTVTVLRGAVSWRSTGPGSSQVVFPVSVAALAIVATNTTYRFVLAPGEYVFRAAFPPPVKPTPWISITVQSGSAQHVDIPNMCI